MAAVTPQKAEKIVYGLRNVHYAVITEGEDGVISFAKPERLPGAVNLGLSENGELVEFYADDIVYWSTNINNGYEGTLELASVPYGFRRDVLGEVEDADKVQYELANAKPSHFALLAEFDTNVIAKRICMFSCLCGRPPVGGETKSNSVKLQAATLSIKARPIELDGKLVVKASTTPETSQEAYDGWFTEVHAFGVASI